MIWTHKKLLLVLIVSSLIFVTAIVAVTFFEKNKIKRGEFITIQNYDSHVKNLPLSEKEAIEKSLYNTATFNYSNKEFLMQMDDALIRDGSYSQDFGNNIYKTSFIVDIKSIGQSYRIEDSFSKLSIKESGLSDYTTMVLCVDKKDLIYGDFSCQDVTSQESGVSKVDPILRYLPRSTLTYTLSLDPLSGNLHLYADMILSNADYRTGVAQAVDKYKKEIEVWFTSNGLDVKDYLITYRY